MKDFFNKTWVKITSWIFLLVGAVALILGGTSVAEIGKGGLGRDVRYGTVVSFCDKLCNGLKNHGDYLLKSSYSPHLRPFVIW